MKRVIVLLFVASITLAQSPDGAAVRGDSLTTRKRLSEAEQLRLAGKVAEAREAMAKIVEDAGDDLVTIGDGRSIPARRVAQTLYGQFADEHLAAIRKQQEPAAAKALTVAKLTRDSRQLEDIAEDSFHTRAAGDARLLLGDLAFERGEYATAERHWQRLLTGSEHRHTGADIHGYDVRARIALAAIHAGDLPRAVRETKLLEAANATATGVLAGRNGNYVETLKLLIANPPLPTISKPQLTDWQTLGGSASRCGRVPGNLIGLASAPAWITPLSGGASVGPIINTVRRIGFHGVFDAHALYVAQAGQILAFDLATGASTVLFDTLQLKADAAFAELAANDWHDADFTLTLAHGHLYARVGPATVLPRENSERTPQASALIRLDTTGLGELPSKLVWVRKPPVAAGVAAGWEGSPLVVDGRILAVFTRLDGGRSVQAIACYDDRQTKPLWVTEVCEVGTAGLEKRERQELLTLAGRNVIFASQTGVIAAVDARTGKHAWSVRYAPMKQPRIDGRHRDMSPPVAADGRVFIAPNDSDTLFALDANDGQMLWKCNPVLIDHLIGVADGKVFAAIAGPQRGLRAFDVRTGSTDDPHGWQNHDDPGLGSFGRGLIVGEHLAWPTPSGLHIIRLADGSPARIPLPGPQGNLAFAAGRLAVIAPKEVRFYWLPEAMPSENSPSKPIVIAAKPVTNSIRNPVAISTVLSPLLPVLTATPSLMPLGERVVDRVDNPLLGELGHAKLIADDSVVALAGPHHLARLNRSTGEPVWVLDHAGRSRFWPHTMPTARHFDDQFFADDRVVIVRRTDRKVLFISGDTGIAVHERTTDAEPWSTPPVSMDNGTYAFSDGPGRIAAVVGKFNPLWSFEAGRPASLTGQAAQLHRDGDFVNVIVHRNHGLEIDRLRTESGKAIWRSGPAFLTDHSERIVDAVGDAKTLFVPGRDRVTMIALDTGRITREVPLPPAPRWRLHRLANAIVAVPLGMNPLPLPRADVLLRHSVINLLAVSMTDPEAAPIIIFDPESGEVEHRLAVPALLVDSRMTPRGLAVATPRRWYRME